MGELPTCSVTRSGDGGDAEPCVFTLSRIYSWYTHTLPSDGKIPKSLHWLRYINKVNMALQNQLIYKHKVFFLQSGTAGTWAPQDTWQCWYLQRGICLRCCGATGRRGGKYVKNPTWWAFRWQALECISEQFLCFRYFLIGSDLEKLGTKYYRLLKASKALQNIFTRKEGKSPKQNHTTGEKLNTATPCSEKAVLKAQVHTATAVLTWFRTRTLLPSPSKFLGGDVFCFWGF